MIWTLCKDDRNYGNRSNVNIPWFIFFWVIVKQETKQKRNETQQKRNKIKQERNETRHDRNEMKPKKSSINFKKTKQTLTKRFLHETTIHKIPVADWKTFKIYGKIWLWKKNLEIHRKEEIYLIDTKFLLREAKFNKVTPCNTLKIHLIRPKRLWMCLRTRTICCIMPLVFYVFYHFT